MIRQLKDLKRQNKISSRNAKITLSETGLLKLKTDIRNMSENEVKNKGLNLLKNIVGNILDAYKLLNMTDLEAEETAEQKRRNQQREGLKTLTPKQLITRLPILLAQLKAGNNYEKLKMK